MTLALKMADIEYDSYEKGFDEGREQGAYQKSLETAKLMLGLGIPLEQVQICTSLPLDVIQTLQ